MATTVEVIMKMVGAEPNGKGGGEDPTPPTPPEPKGFLRKFAGGVKKLTGIQFSTAAMLKQSQIFTSTVGVIFQLMGALVDVILAPFIPIIVPAIQWIAKSIPIVSKIAQWIADAIKGIWNWLVAIWNDPIKTIQDSLSYIGDNIVQWIKDALTPFDFNTKWGSLSISFAKLIAYFPRIFPWLLKQIPVLFKGLYIAGKLILKVFAPHLYAILKIGWRLIHPILKPVKDAAFGVWRWISKNLNPVNIFKRLSNFVQNWIKGLYEKAGNFLKGSRLFGGIGKKLTALSKATKAIPVLGAVATAGFGTYEAIQAGRKMGTGGWGGFNYGIAAQYAAKTAAATTATAFGFSGVGLGIDVAGSMALNKYHGGSFLTLEVKTPASDGQVTSMEVVDGIEEQAATNIVLQKT